MKTKRLFVFLLALFLVSPALLFCAGTKEQASTETKDGVITLSVYHYLDQTDKTTAPNFQHLVDVFEQENPNIKLSFEYGYGEAFHDKLQTMAMSGQLPDIILLYPGKRTSQVTSAGLVQDLRPYLAGHEGEFADMAMQGQGEQGEIWELPEDISITSIMYTNNRLLKQLGLTFPKTYEELLAQGEVIRAAGLIPISIANKDAWPMQSCLAGMLVERAGGMAWFDKALAGEASFADPQFVHAMDIIKELNDKQMFSPGTNQLAYGQGLDDFVNERAVYFIDGGWTVNNMVGELTDQQKTYMSLESFPDIPDQQGKSQSASATAGQGFGMNAKLSDAKAQAAWKWIWFYSGPEGSAIRQRYGRLPAYNLAEPADADPMIKKLIAFAARVPMGYVMDSVIDAEPIGTFNINLQNMMFGTMTSTQVAQELETMVQAIGR
ncbi:MAG: ABC transporter substrate-binding protein [Sphaerochaeta sp.]|jgi:raffinose/stachyose/melibiose transport system substrate-binding protein|uniref:ABC transporter substrate-binding protein n=1 Tax=Sphaerochaeta sp. TaxID=1972642 RepID=UPI003D106A85